METTQNMSASESEALLLRACELRQQLYAKLRRSMEEDTHAYDEEMRKLHQEIDKIMKRL